MKIEQFAPIGIMPKYIWEEKRFEELRDAILRYTEGRWTIPEKWIEEYNDLIKNRTDRS